MHARSILDNLLKDVMPQMHSTRRQSVQAAVRSVLDGAMLSVTSVGRGIEPGAFEKHRIKRADRLLSNRHFQNERFALYQAMGRLVLGTIPRPVISVDWSNLGRCKTRYLLRASVAVSGRAITLYEEAHPREGFMKARVERRFLSRLAELLGPSRRPVIITDAGFHNPWLRAVAALGWDFVGRGRGRVMLASDTDNDWEHARSMFPLATKTPRTLSKSRRSRANPIQCHFVLVKQPRRYRHDSNIMGRRAQGHYSNKQARAQREPWLLATSLPLNHRLACQRVVDCYTTRMQIEEAFRDINSQRFGLAYRACQSQRLERIQMLLLIAHLAQLVAWVLALRVIAAGLHRRYQANTVANRTVLSMVYLGRRVWQDPPTPAIVDPGPKVFDELRQFIQQQNNL